jgi:hypothetical protein
MIDFSEPHEVSRLLHDLKCPWGIAGGWAIDLFLDRVTREHQDVEIAIFRQDQLTLQDYLCFRGWSLDYVRDRRFNPWLKGEFLVSPVHEIWGRSGSEPRQRLEVLLNECPTDAFIFRRDPRIRIQLERVFLRSNSGISILAPEIVLLYKSKRATEHKEQLDFSSTLAALDAERRGWLIDSLALLDPEHDWLAALKDPITKRDMVWQLEHSVETAVSLEFAWKYRTDLANWNDPPAQFVLDGPFIAGSRGTTLLPGQQPLHWSIREVRPMQAFVIEMQLDQAVLTFEWRFDALSERTTMMTQKVVLSGDNAATFVEQVEGFRPGLADGMKRIATEMAAAEGRRT